MQCIQKVSTDITKYLKLKGNLLFMQCYIITLRLWLINALLPADETSMFFIQQN